MPQDSGTATPNQIFLDTLFRRDGSALLGKLIFLSFRPRTSAISALRMTGYRSRNSADLARGERSAATINLTKSTTLMINFTNESWENPLHGYGEGGLWGDSKLAGGERFMVAAEQDACGQTDLDHRLQLGQPTFAFSWSANRINITQAATIRNCSSRSFPPCPSFSPPAASYTRPSATDLLVLYIYGIPRPLNNRQDLYAWKDISPSR